MAHNQSYTNKNIWIIGASSGIGAALAKELSSRGANLAISARRTSELEKIKATLSGENHQILALDVTDLEATKKAAELLQLKFSHLDSVIFLSAAYTPMKLNALDTLATHQIINTNLLGAFNIVQTVIPILIQQSFGQIALCGSLAGYYGLPNGQPYSATKAGIINLAESLRSELPQAIDVKLISPGFVRTALTDKNNFTMPMLLEPAQAASLIATGLLKKGFEIHFPKFLSYWLKLLRILPYRFSLKISRHYTENMEG